MADFDAEDGYERDWEVVGDGVVDLVGEEVVLEDGGEDGRGVSEVCLLYW